MLQTEMKEKLSLDLLLIFKGTFPKALGLACLRNMCKILMSDPETVLMTSKCF